MDQEECRPLWYPLDQISSILLRPWRTFSEHSCPFWWWSCQFSAKDSSRVFHRSDYSAKEYKTSKIFKSTWGLERRKTLFLCTGDNLGMTQCLAWRIKHIGITLKKNKRIKHIGITLKKWKKLLSIPPNSKNYFSIFFIYIPDLSYNYNHSLHITRYCALKKNDKHFLYSYLAYIIIISNGWIVGPLVDIL